MNVIANRPLKSARKAEGRRPPSARGDTARGGTDLRQRRLSGRHDPQDRRRSRRVLHRSLYALPRQGRDPAGDPCQGAVAAALLASNTEISSRPIDTVLRVRQMPEAYMRFGLREPQHTYLLAFCSVARVAETGPSLTLADLGSRCYQLFKGAVPLIAAEEGPTAHGTVDNAAPETPEFSLSMARRPLRITRHLDRVGAGRRADVGHARRAVPRLGHRLTWRCAPGAAAGGGAQV